MDVLVFKTSVSSQGEIEPLRASLTPLGKWNFDLEDCDRILRIESATTQPIEVIRTLKEKGYFCSELE